MRRYLRNLAIALDQGLNTLLGGDPDETISSRVGRAAQAGKRWGRTAERIIDRLFIWLGEGPGHCQRSIEVARCAHGRWHD